MAISRNFNAIKKLTTSRHYLFNATWLVSGSFVQQLVQLIFLTLLVRKFTIEQVGEFQFALIIIGLLKISSLPGMATSITQSTSRGFDGTFHVGTKIQFLASLVGACLLFLYALVFPSQLQGVNTALFIVSGLFPFSIGLRGWSAQFMGEKRFKLLAWLETCNVIFAYVVMILLITYSNIPIGYLIIIPYLVAAILNISIFMKKFNQIIHSSVPEPGSIKYGLKNSFYEVVNTCANYLDSLLIYTFLTSGDLAAFIIASKIPEAFKKYIQRSRMVLIPKLSKMDFYTSNINSIFFMLSLVLSFIIIIIALAIIPIIFNLLFTNEYEHAILISQLLMLSLVAGQVAQWRRVFLNSKLDSAAVKRITLKSNIVRIGTSMLLVPLFGLYGAVISTFIYRLANSYFVSEQIKKYT